MVLAYFDTKANSNGDVDGFIIQSYRRPSDETDNAYNQSAE